MCLLCFLILYIYHDLRAHNEKEAKRERERERDRRLVISSTVVGRKHLRLHQKAMDGETTSGTV